MEYPRGERASELQHEGDGVLPTAAGDHHSTPLGWAGEELIGDLQGHVDVVILRAVGGGAVGGKRRSSVSNGHARVQRMSTVEQAA
jgi:hypothetical protein